MSGVTDRDRALAIVEVSPIFNTRSDFIDRTETVLAALFDAAEQREHEREVARLHTIEPGGPRIGTTCRVCGLVFMPGGEAGWGGLYCVDCREAAQDYAASFAPEGLEMWAQREHEWLQRAREYRGGS